MNKSEIKIKDKEILKSRRKAEKYWKLLRTRYRISITWFVLLNVFSFLLAALLIFLNIYAIKLNKDNTTKLLFVIIAIISSLTATLGALKVFFRLGNKLRENREKISSINSEIKLYKAQKNKSEDQDRNELFLNKILKILYRK